MKPAGTDAEPAPEPPVPAAGGRAFVRDYYAALNARRFAAAWRMLSPAVQARFGGFDRWRAGYARTVSQSPARVVVSAAGSRATVGLTLRARDCGGAAEHRFAVTWRLARTEAGWRATAASGRRLGGPAPC